ncbi:hypothetical protein I79_003708 [Cricetulus griseus]|uniref:Uncharacterized protein n=1 Tax=Cricetulus griseus TaxID=10029 RepID=G3H0P4_CRIGR|nr:hypothetical protein I79_003708 [Cricetulus griseus]
MLLCIRFLQFLLRLRKDYCCCARNTLSHTAPEGQPFRTPKVGRGREEVPAAHKQRN